MREKSRTNPLILAFSPKEEKVIRLRFGLDVVPTSEFEMTDRELEDVAAGATGGAKDDAQGT